MKNFVSENFFPIANAGQIIAKTLGKPLPASPQCPPVKHPVNAQRNYKPNLMEPARIPSRP